MLSIKPHERTTLGLQSSKLDLQLGAMHLQRISCLEFRKHVSKIMWRPALCDCTQKLQHTCNQGWLSHKADSMTLIAGCSDVRGCMQFAAPEVLACQAARFDACLQFPDKSATAPALTSTVDSWALALTVYHMLTGLNLFKLEETDEQVSVDTADYLSMMQYHSHLVSPDHGLRCKISHMLP